MRVVEELTYTLNVQARRLSLGKALETAGVPVRNEDYGEDERGRRQVQELARRIVILPSAPTALFAASDTQAVGVFGAAHEMGLEIPRDLSVVGYDDTETPDIPALTTMRQLLFESGRRGELLLETPKSLETEPVYKVLQTELIVGDTTAPPLV